MPAESDSDEDDEEMLISDEDVAESEELESGDEVVYDDDDEDEEVLEPKVLPHRTTRALRMNKLLEEEDSADEDFWNQDFFAEEAKDAEFEASDSEQEDVPDSDFSESEDEDDEDEDEVEARVRREERSRKKTLKPPGAAAARKPAPLRPRSAAKLTSVVPLSPSTQAAIRVAQEAEAAEQFEAPTLRKSTRQRVEEAEKERERMEQVRPRKRRLETLIRPLTQQELLAEAAQTEIENLRSLEALQAAEEEIKKKAAVIRARHMGPCIHYHSKSVNGESLVTCGVANMLLPPNMRKQKAPPPRQRAICVVTGKPARYLDPLTRQPYHDAAAFRAIRQRFVPQPQILERSQRRRAGAWNSEGEWA